MIELINERLCSVEERGGLLDHKCPCLISLNNKPYCALDYFDASVRTVWYNTELERVEHGERPSNDWSSATLRPARCIERNRGPTLELSVREKRMLIHMLHLKWIAHLRFHKKDSRVDSMMIEYKDDPPEKWPVVLIPICTVTGNKVAEVYTTAKCFTPAVDSSDLPVFAYKGILEFLQAHHIEFMVGTIDCWNFALDEQEGLPLCVIALKTEPPVGKAFEFFVRTYGGSLCMEERDGWCIFQST